jgi:hypothetical protein
MTLSARRMTGLLLLAAALSAIYVLKIAHRMPDFEVYRRAGLRAAHAEGLYRESDGHYQFKYLPAFAIAAVPLGILPAPLSRAMWFAVSLGLLVWLLALSHRILPDRRRSAGYLIAATSIVLAKFYAHEIELGQVNILMTWLVVAAAYSMRRGFEGTGGTLVAAAIVVKPYAVILLPYLAARRRAASIATSIAGLAAALLLPAVVYGSSGAIALTTGWWRTVTATTAPNLLDFNNVSAASVFARALGPGPAAQLAALAMTLGVLAAASFVFLKRRGLAHPEALEIAFLLTTMPIISPQGWDYVFLVSTPAVMLLVNYSDALPRGLRMATAIALVVIGFSVFDLMGRQAYRAFMMSSAITWCYVVVLAGLAALRVRRVA